LHRGFDHFATTSQIAQAASPPTITKTLGTGTLSANGATKRPGTDGTFANFYSSKNWGTSRLSPYFTPYFTHISPVPIFHPSAVKLAVAGVGKRSKDGAGALIDRLTNVHGEGEYNDEKE